MKVCLPILAVLISFSYGADSKEPLRTSACALYDVTQQKFVIKDGYQSGCIVSGQFINSGNTTGWGELGIKSVDTSRSWNDSAMAYAAGLVEGYLTKTLIEQFYFNTLATYCPYTLPWTPYCSQLNKYLISNLDWVRSMITDNPQDPYWYQVRLFYEQLAGLEDGYKDTPGQVHLDIDVFGLFLMQINDDLGDLEKVLGKPGVGNSRPIGHCSALVKLLPEYDLLTSHDTWSGYNTMLRILKVYDLPYYTTVQKTEKIAGSSISFSSYPGYLYSSDDYYITSARMIVMETTNPTNNLTLFHGLKPEGIVMEGIRNQVANRMANSGLEWAQIFSKYNSGTYNNQWMVVDYKQITELPPARLLMVLEQIPGYIHYEDQTELLMKKGYWSSFNRIYYPDVFERSGEQELIDKYGDYFTHDKTSRALIFDRDQGSVHDMPSLFKLMRYNDYTKDPLSQCNCTPPYSANLAIMMRGDLNPANGVYPFSELGRALVGGIDTKAASLLYVKELSFFAQNGPTSDDQAPFKWSDIPISEQTPHVGQPDVFDFPVISFNVSNVLNTF
ncbi:putative phospholipase B-like 2 isoform X1 [Patella vulgata]|uniref:putative phospholipase B-like 2 isoform X1 n=2 Tax=Patella vulgata TaxID=6465 RepID=UPI0021804373|nr:putative phospholipase B-like 2 isoform X1 [Patella vulgata]